MSDAPDFSNFSAGLQLLSHVYFSPVIATLVRHGVPDHLDSGPLPAVELAQRSELNELAMTRALRALTAFGAFHEVSPGTFANNGVSNLYRNRPGGLRNAALFYGSDHYLKSATGLGHAVKTGESATHHVHGDSVWNHFRNNPEEAEAFNRALAELRGNEHQLMADAYDWSNVHTVADIGGGVGALLAAFLKKSPSMHGILFEQAEVLPQADTVLSESGVRERCQLVAGSFFDPIPVTADVWTMCQVLHDWTDADCIRILQRCRQAMRPADRLLVCEMVPVPCQPNIPISITDMAMLMFFGEARQRTADEYRQLFDATGFAFTRVLPTQGNFSLVEAKPI